MSATNTRLKLLLIICYKISALVAMYQKQVSRSIGYHGYVNFGGHVCHGGHGGHGNKGRYDGKPTSIDSTTLGWMDNAPTII